MAGSGSAVSVIITTAGVGKASDHGDVVSGIRQMAII